MNKLRTLALASALLMASCNVGGGEPDPRYTYAEAGFDTVRIVLLPEGHRVYVLRDRVSGHCFTFTRAGNGTHIVSQVTDDVCGPA